MDRRTGYFADCTANGNRVVGRTPWSARVPLDPLFVQAKSAFRHVREADRASAADRGPPHKFPAGHRIVGKLSGIDHECVRHDADARPSRWSSPAPTSPPNSAPCPQNCAPFRLPAAPPPYTASSGPSSGIIATSSPANSAAPSHALENRSRHDAGLPPIPDSPLHSAADCRAASPPRTACRAPSASRWYALPTAGWAQRRS